MTQLKVMTVVGTRPEIIRLSRVFARLEEHVEHVMVHTGQNYDYELNGIFFDQLGVRKPDHFLECAGDSLGQTLGNILARSEAIIEREMPDALLILGDTNSALAAIMARRLHIPIYHMEAGNRCFDRNVPEETNRRIVDHISDFNLVYTEHARRHLLAEGLPHRRIYLTGSPMFEVLTHFSEEISGSQALEVLGLEPQGYFLASLHREENVDNPHKLAGMLAALRDLANRHGKKVVVSTHPRTRKRLDAIDEKFEDFIFSKPFGFFEYNKLQSSAYCVISDSGTIAEEAIMLGFPAVTPRLSIERPEAMDTGGIVVSGTEPANLIECTELALRTFPSGPTRDERYFPAEYRCANTSERVVNLICGTARLSNKWDGITPAWTDGGSL